VPDKRLWHLRVRALAASGQWAALGLLASEKKSPIGYAPFARAAMRQGQPAAEVEGYVERIAQADEK
jgi:vacuolar protein sorting-associated protein 16